MFPSSGLHWELKPMLTPLFPTQLALDNPLLPEVRPGASKEEARDMLEAERGSGSSGRRAVIRQARRHGTHGDGAGGASSPL